MVSNIKQQLIITKNELSDLMAMLYAVSLNEKSIPLFTTPGIPRNDESIKKMFLNTNFTKTLDSHFNELFINNANTEYARLYNESLSRTKKRLLSMLTDVTYDGISNKLLPEKISERFSREFDTITRGLPLMAQTVNAQSNNNKTFDVLSKFGVKEFEIIANEDACEICVDNAGTYTAQEIERLGLFPPFHPNCKCSLEPWTETKTKKQGESYLFSQMAIDTDGVGSVYPGGTHQGQTSYMNGILDAEIHPYVVIPTNHPDYRATLGCLVVVVDHDTGNYAYGIVGDGGPKDKYGEISIKIAWDLGYDTDGHWGPKGDFELIIFPDSEQDWDPNDLTNHINRVGPQYYP